MISKLPVLFRNRGGVEWFKTCGLDAADPNTLLQQLQEVKDNNAAVVGGLADTEALISLKDLLKCLNSNLNSALRRCFPWLEQAKYTWHSY